MINWKKKDIIKYLSIDPIFGIYTRQYMEYLIRSKNLKHVYILDFEGISQMNSEVGYEEVNRRFTKLFKKKYKKVFVGRCFSGDEILICGKKDYISIIEKLQKRANRIGLNFRYIKLDLNLSSIIDSKIKEIKF